MILNSNKLIETFSTKYILPTNVMNPQRFELCKPMHVDDHDHESVGDNNYTFILRCLSKHEKAMFIRFFEVFLYRIYTVKKCFRQGYDVDWSSLNSFLLSNDSYEHLFLTCFHYYFWSISIVYYFIRLLYHHVESRGRDVLIFCFSLMF